MKKLFLVLIIFGGCEKESNSNPKGLKTENVILITLDGVRWEDLFYGADKKIVLDTLFVKDVEATSAKFWSEDYRERRKLVFPFFGTRLENRVKSMGIKNRGASCD